MIDTITAEELRRIDKMVAVALGRSLGSPELEKSPHFTTDPTAADTVRREIENRGWMWEVGMTSSVPSYLATITIIPAKVETGRGKKKPPLGKARISGESPFIALCLAFISVSNCKRSR
jgi:hypothetical protein